MMTKEKLIASDRNRTVEFQIQSPQAKIGVTINNNSLKR